MSQLIIREYSKRTARGKLRKVIATPTFYNARVFDIPYRSKICHRFVLSEVRHLTSARFRQFPKAYQQEEATRWREAVVRDAPLLKGFFEEEPQWRNKILRWSERVLAQARKTAK